MYWRKGVRGLRSLLATAAFVGMIGGPAMAQTPRTPAPTPTEQALQTKINDLEKRLADMEEHMKAMMAAPSAQQAATPAAADADKTADLDRRVTDLETNTVFSMPKTMVKQVDVYVDQNGHEFDEPGPGRVKSTTYQRERVYRRQDINEAIEEAMSGDGIAVGVSSVTSVQAAFQNKGPDNVADGRVYGLSAADITFAANSAALNTTFFADVVGIGGSPPDAEIDALNLINSQAARLSNNQINLREAWIQTGLFAETLHLSIGRLDLTNYFDRNTAANDENSMFISDALVNNPVLGLSSNGLGVAAVYNPGGDFNFKLGVQQSSPSATSLSDALFTLGEAEYIARPFGLPEGHYRLWGRTDNSSGDDRTAFGVSIDQKIAAPVTLFARYGSGYVDGVGGAIRFYSGGVSFGAPMAFNPDDTWGIGYAQTEIKSGPDAGATERLGEAFYNLYLTEAMRVSGTLQYVFESQTGEGYILPGARLAVEF